MGKTGQFSDPEFSAAVARVGNACKEAGKYSWTIGIRQEISKTFFENGYNGIALSDTAFLIQGAQQYLKNFKG